MKNRRILFVLLMAFVLLLAGTAQAAEEESMKYFNAYCTPGQVRMPRYSYYFSCLGDQLDPNDYTFTYRSGSEYLTVDADGTCHFSEDIFPLDLLTLYVTCTPKAGSASKTIQYKVTFHTIDPFEKFAVSPTTLYSLVSNTGTLLVQVTGISDRRWQFEEISYDKDFLSMSLKNDYMDGDPLYAVKLKGKTGTSDIVFHAIDGQTRTVHVVVTPDPTKLELGVDNIVCYKGDTVDLGIDMGNGPDGVKAANISASINYLYEVWSAESYKFFPDDNNTLYAYQSGYYSLSLSYEKFSASTRLTVYDREKCASIQLSTSTLFKNSGRQKVYCYDAQGNEICRPIHIVSGADIVTLDNNYLTATEAGTVTLGVENLDGTVTTQTFEIHEPPTQMTLNAVEVKLEIGQTFDLKVSFDSTPVSFSKTIDYDETYPADGLHCIRMEGDRIIAQKPGTATIQYYTYLTAGVESLYATCKVTVPDSEKKVHLVVPGETVAVGESVKLSVQDETGKVYPATFSTQSGLVDAFIIYPDGTLTALAATEHCRIQAQLDDGRILRRTIVLLQKPKWLKHDGVIGFVENHYLNPGSPSSDVGEIPLEEITLTVADETIARVEGSALIPLRAGLTTATMTSIHTGASVTFPVEILDDRKLFVGSTSVRIPYGFGVQLPEVRDGNGQTVPITWTITYDMPGEGNPEPSGFVLEDDVISCVWPTAKCVVTGTAKDKSTVKINVSGYQLPESITVEPDGAKVTAGGKKTFRVLPEQAGTEVNRVYWLPEDPEIVSCEEITDGDSNEIQGKKAGKTRVMALLDNGVYTVFDVIVSEDGSVIPGDANADKKVDTQDALMVMQYDAGWGVDISMYASDVNADGRVDSSDALLIFQRTAGMNVLLRKYEPQDE